MHKEDFMDKYKKLKMVQGLIMALDEQIYRHEQFKKLDKETEKKLVDEYFKCVLETLRTEESKNERTS